MARLFLQAVVLGIRDYAHHFHILDIAGIGIADVLPDRIRKYAASHRG